jgi:hypothetical protein
MKLVPRLVEKIIVPHNLMRCCWIFEIVGDISYRRPGLSTCSVVPSDAVLYVEFLLRFGFILELHSGEPMYALKLRL